MTKPKQTELPGMRPKRIVALVSEPLLAIVLLSLWSLLVMA